MTVVAAIVAVAALIWGAIFFRQAGLFGACLAVLFVGSCFGHPFFHASVGPLPITLDRVLLGVVFLGFLAYRWLGETPRRRFDRQDLLLIAFIGVLCVSTFSHDWRADGHRAAALLLFFYLLPVVVYFIARESPVSPRVMLGVLAAIACFGLYLSFTAICEKFQIYSLVFPKYIASEAHHEFFGRARGPYLNPAGNGLFLCAGLVSLMMFWPRGSRVVKLGIGLATVIYLLGIYCTMTRCVWLAAGLGLVIVGGLNLPRRWSLALVVAAAVGSGLFVMVMWEDLNAFKRDKHVSVADMAQSASLRPILAYVAWQMFLDRPVLGCGLGQYAHESVYYLSDRSTKMPLERARTFVQHNVYLGLLVETGAVGFLLYSILTIVWVQSAWKLWFSERAPPEYRQMGLVLLVTLVAYLSIGMFQDLSIVPMVNMLIFLLAGTVHGLHGAIAPVTEPVPSATRQLSGVGCQVSRC